MGECLDGHHPFWDWLTNKLEWVVPVLCYEPVWRTCNLICWFFILTLQLNCICMTIAWPGQSRQRLSLWLDWVSLSFSILWRFRFWTISIATVSLPLPLYSTEFLYLDNNDLTGPIPSEIGLLTNLSKCCYCDAFALHRMTCPSPHWNRCIVSILQLTCGCSTTTWQESSRVQNLFPCVSSPAIASPAILIVALFKRVRLALAS